MPWVWRAREECDCCEHSEDRDHCGHCPAQSDPPRPLATRRPFHSQAAATQQIQLDAVAAAVVVVVVVATEKNTN